MQGFRSHIKEAIALNRKRKPYYASLTNGESVSLSNSLILMEKLVIPIACYYDLKAKKFNKKGIPIVLDDFVPMKVKPIESLPKFTSHFADELFKKEVENVKFFLKRLNRSRDLKNIHDISSGFLESVQKSEKENDVHFAMLSHLLESIILISFNGLIYAARSSGKTEKLSLSLIRLHKIAIRFALYIDKKANYLHQKKVGIIINDLPKIKIP